MAKANNLGAQVNQSITLLSNSFGGGQEASCRPRGDWAKIGKVPLETTRRIQPHPGHALTNRSLSWTCSESQEALLFEHAEADSLNFLERQVFFKSRIVNYGEEDVLSPVHWCAKYLAWMFIVVYAVGLSFYVCLFAVKAGRATSVQWMASFWIAFVEVRRW